MTWLGTSQSSAWLSVFHYQKVNGREYLLIASYKYFWLIIVISLNIDKEIQVIVLLLEQSGYIGEGYHYFTGTVVPCFSSVKRLYTEGQISGSSVGKKVAWFGTWPDFEHNLWLDLFSKKDLGLILSAKLLFSLEANSWSSVTPYFGPIASFNLQMLQDASPCWSHNLSKKSSEYCELNEYICAYS